MSALKEYEVLAGNCVYHDGKLCEEGDVIELTDDQAVTHGENVRLSEPTKPGKNANKHVVTAQPE